MDNTTKKFIEGQIEKLTEMVAQGFAATATKVEVKKEIEKAVTAIKIEMKEEIEKLAIMTAGGFAVTATKTELNELRDEVNELHVEMSGHFNIIEFRLGNQQQELDEFRDRMKVLETRVDKIETVRN